MVANLTSKFSEYISGATSDDPHVVDATTAIVLDTIGSAAAGMRTEAGKRLAAMKYAQGGTAESTMIGHKSRVPASSAAYVHSHAANLLDIDETLHHRTHFACCIVMPALALAEANDVSGTVLLDAVAVGYDVAARLCLSLPSYDVSDPAEIRLLPMLGYGPAALGTAAACARVLGLDPTRTQHALAIAYSSAPVRRPRHAGDQPFSFAMTKYTFYAPISDAGVNAALLAQAGFEAEDGCLDVAGEYWRAFGADSVDLDVMTSSLGQRWYVNEASIKPYPSCRQSGVALDMFAEVLGEQGWAAGDIDEIVLTIPPLELVRQLALNVDPGDTVSSQFSIPYAMAMLADRVPIGEWHEEERLRAGAWRSLAGRVRVEVRDEWHSAVTDEVLRLGTYRQIPMNLVVRAGGSTVSKSARRPNGDPDSVGDVSDYPELARKFAGLVGTGLDGHAVRSVVDGVQCLRSGAAIGPLMAVLAAPPVEG